MKKIKNVLVFLFVIITITTSSAISQSQMFDVKESPTGEKNFRKVEKFNELIDFKRIDFDRINEIIFYMTNEIRAKHRLQPLTYATELERSAWMHADDMVRGNFFSHINERDSKKKTPNDRAKMCNISNPMLAENLIEGFGLKYNANESVYLRGKGKFSKTQEGELIKPHTYISFCEVQMERWMNSKEHRKNILSKDALQFGCGAAIFENAEFNQMPTFYVVQNFQCYQPLKKIDP